MVTQRGLAVGAHISGAIYADCEGLQIPNRSTIVANKANNFCFIILKLNLEIIIDRLRLKLRCALPVVSIYMEKTFFPSK